MNTPLPVLLSDTSLNRAIYQGLCIHQLRDAIINSFVIEETEAELEAQLMEQAAAERVSQGQFLQGRHLTGRKKVNPNAAQKKNFQRLFCTTAIQSGNFYLL